MSARFGIIGLGEAGGAIAAGLVSAGATVVGYDATPNPVVHERCRSVGVTVVKDVEALAADADLTICLTSAKVAVSVAEALAPFLTQRHIYSDWNSASPEVKHQIADLVEARGAMFVDGAVMAAVPPQRHAVPVLLSGNGAAAFMAAVDGLGMQLENLGPEPGQASAVKMFRSLLVKGLEALLVECIVGADRYGAARRVLTSMNGTLPTEDWNELTTYLVTRAVQHGHRRAEELRQVTVTLAEAGVEPLLAPAGAARLQWFADLGLGAELAHTGWQSYEDVLRLIDKRGR